MPRHYVVLSRLLFVASVLGTTDLARTGADYPVVTEVNDKVSHVAAFFVLGLLLDYSFPNRPYGAIKIIVLLAYGALLELAQSTTPARDPSLWDLGADLAGLLLYALTIPLLRYLPVVRRRWTT